MENIKVLEAIIRTQLKSLGYFSIEIGEEYDKGFNVLADGNLRNIFLKVLIRAVSDRLSELTSEEIITIKLKAETVKKEPWAAIMSVNEQGQLVDGIEWRNLSKIAV